MRSVRTGQRDIGVMHHIQRVGLVDHWQGRDLFERVDAEMTGNRRDRDTARANHQQAARQPVKDCALAATFPAIRLPSNLGVSA
ncbi:MAG: hypothetical protein HRU31_11560 [Rhodobacteraceae bacterium]|nr:hypothetical protein [Paracoccaceae bacterium]